jgi:hypothetical protein
MVSFDFGRQESIIPVFNSVGGVNLVDAADKIPGAAGFIRIVCAAAV